MASFLVTNMDDSTYVIDAENKAAVRHVIGPHRVKKVETYDPAKHLSEEEYAEYVKLTTPEPTPEPTPPEA